MSVTVAEVSEGEAGPLERARADYRRGARTEPAMLYATVHGLRDKYPLLTQHEKWALLKSTIDKLSHEDREALRLWLAQKFEARIVRGA